MKIEKINAKSMLVLSNLPDTDYVVNPYTGCQFACLYCYASFMGRFVGESRSNWGNYVYVKSNAVDIIREELAKWSNTKCQSSVLLSSVTDPYQGLEKKYQLTRGILQEFLNRQYPGLISILTKSSLVLRDLDVIKQLSNVEVGMTITTTDDNLSHFLEVEAPAVTQRLKTLKKLNEFGIKTYAFIGPLLPHFRYETHLLEKLFIEIAESGVQEVYIEHINLPSYIKERLFPELLSKSEEVQKIYKGAIAKEHRNILDLQVKRLLLTYGLNVRLGGAIYHPELE
jgi:DNA repair photolyase